MRRVAGACCVASLLPSVLSGSGCDPFDASSTPADAGGSDVSTTDGTTAEAGADGALGACGALPPGVLVAFVTEAAYPVAGGVTALDAYCQGAATAAGLGGTFRAFVVVGTDPVGTRVGDASSWVRVDGKEVFTHPPATQNRDPLPIPLNVTAACKVLTSDAGVWTGAGKLFSPGSNCSDWTDRDGEATFGDPMSTTAYDFVGRGPCSELRHLYCFASP